MELYVRNFIQGVTVSLLVVALLGLLALAYELWERNWQTKVASTISIFGLASVLLASYFQPESVYLFLPILSFGGAFWILGSVSYYNQLRKQNVRLSYPIPATSLFTSAGRWTLVLTVCFTLIATVNHNANTIVKSQEQFIKAEKQRISLLKSFEEKLMKAATDSIVVIKEKPVFIPAPRTPVTYPIAKVKLPRVQKTNPILRTEYARKQMLEALKDTIDN